MKRGALRQRETEAARKIRAPRLPARRTPSTPTKPAQPPKEATWKKPKSSFRSSRPTSIIDRAAPCEETACAVSHAVLDTAPDLERAVVNTEEITLTGADDAVDRYRPSPKLPNRITRYDSGDPVETISVTLRRRPRERTGTAVLRAR